MYQIESINDANKEINNLLSNSSSGFKNWLKIAPKNKITFGFIRAVRIPNVKEL